MVVKCHGRTASAYGFDLGLDRQIARALAFVRPVAERKCESGCRHAPDEVNYDGPPRLLRRN